MPKSFIYVQNRGNAIGLDQTAPLTHLNIDYPRTAKHTLRDEPRAQLRIPYGHKDVALKLGARYGAAGLYAPPRVDLAAFGERGWL
jgi:hypothetical protein